MTVTVAVCTLDRPRLLRQTLESLAEAAVPDGLDWEVLVVDNGGREATGVVVEDLRERLPLRRVREHELGHSHARNRSVEEAPGEWIIWIDDDVRVDVDWLSSYVEAFRSWPGAAFLGGPIRPTFEGTPPRWLRRAFDELTPVREAYGYRDLGPDPRPIRRREDLPFGGNFAARLDVLPPDPFDPRLGRRGAGLLGGEELDVMGGLLDQGHEGRWVPGAELEHVVPPARQTQSFLRGYFRAQGRVQEPLPEDRPVPELFGKPRWALRARVEEELKCRLLRPFAPPERWVAHLIDASFAAGALKGPPWDETEDREPKTARETPGARSGD